jgi:hypothetical protein
VLVRVRWRGGGVVDVVVVGDRNVCSRCVAGMQVRDRDVADAAVLEWCDYAPDGSLKRVFQGLWRGDWAVVTAGYEYRKWARGECLVIDGLVASASIFLSLCLCCFSWEKGGTLSLLWVEDRFGGEQERPVASAWCAGRRR